MTQESFSSVLVRNMLLVAASALATLTAGFTIYVLIWYQFHPPTTTDTFAWYDFVALAVVVIVSLLIAAFMGVRLGKKVVNALLAIGRAAGAIATGNFSIRVPQQGSPLGEIDDVIDNFNRMAELLESAEGELRYQNSAIAHELRTPLTILRGRLQGMRDGVFQPSPQLYDALISHVDGMTNIVEDLRILALSNAGKLELRLEHGNLADEIASTVQAMQGELERHGMVLTLDLGLVPISMDKARIRQAIVAVVDNAIHYAPHSKLQLTTRKIGKTGVFRCSDAGPGMSDDEITNVFDRFWRADASRSRAGGGSGLGLSVVRAIAEAHDGAVAAKRNEMGGMTFEIELPLDRPQSRTSSD
ncbi:ATP-binding protein [Devosia sp. LjRoot3]|uniref:ATP-binding protein n=1 Tax=Devosia sp. LjRoot3 TaxID=3342319 RepID=UPI003ED0B57D